MSAAPQPSERKHDDATLTTTLTTTVEFEDWWFTKSLLIKRGTLLYKFKKRMQELLRLRGLMYVDRPNGVPHVAVTTDAKARDHEARQAVEGCVLNLDVNTFVIENDNIQIPIPVMSPVIGATHMTLFFTKRVDFKTDAAAYELVKCAFRDTLQSLLDEPIAAEGSQWFKIDTELNSFEIDADKKRQSENDKSSKRKPGEADKSHRRQKKHAKKDPLLADLVDVMHSISTTLVEVRDALRARNASTVVTPSASVASPL